MDTLGPGTCECHLLWQRDFAGVTELRILRWEDILDYLGGPVSSKGPCKREGGSRGEARGPCKGRRE